MHVGKATASVNVMYQSTYCIAQNSGGGELR